MTDADRHARASALFLLLVKRAPDEREAALREEAPEVQSQARALLDGHETPGPLDADRSWLRNEGGAGV